MGYDTSLSLDRELPDLFSGNRTKAMDDAQTAKTASQAEKDVLANKAEADAQAKKEQPSDIELNNERIRESLESLNQFIPLVNTNLVFEFDDLNEPPIIKVIDKESKELIREIPSRDLDKVAKAFGDMVDTLNKSGALFNTEI
ncbi:flagellar protein FlaG [Rheinheimera sp.]|uniref:flagellar protein FlaG n=1 Tax=Rheinheimera sp. TaxID=1869214 RepID=UPI0027BA7011|nr:flagellar protein FlaG [Rheinheimera sp.]